MNLEEFSKAKDSIIEGYNTTGRFNQIEDCYTCNNKKVRTRTIRFTVDACKVRVCKLCYAKILNTIRDMIGEKYG
jgi:hypothetical protein